MTQETISRVDTNDTEKLLRLIMMQEGHTGQDLNPAFAGLFEYGTGKISLGGHRGMGANHWNEEGPVQKDCPGPLYRENTISSFVAAANAGATFVEFDVQVTADDVPVLFHDGYVIFGEPENPTSMQLKDVSVSHFKGMAPINSSSDLGSLWGASDDEVSSTSQFPVLGGMSPPARGMSPPPGGISPPAGMSPRGGSIDGGSPRSNPWGFLMRHHKHDAPAAPSDKSLSVWEVEHEDEFPTLLEVFEQVPAHVAFDIEIKMTSPSDLEKTPQEEIDRVVNATVNSINSIERRVEEEGLPKRPLMFSSFDPDVCLAIKQKRPKDCVMFLSGGGKYEHVDPRRTSINAAIQFARVSNLQGIILHSGALFEDKDSVEEAHAYGLVVMTYGEENDDPEWVLEQEKLRVHGVIVDDVVGISNCFRERPAINNNANMEE